MSDSYKGELTLVHHTPEMRKGTYMGHIGL